MVLHAVAGLLLLMLQLELKLLFYFTHKCTLMLERGTATQYGQLLGIGHWLFGGGRWEKWVMDCHGCVTVLTVTTCWWEVFPQMAVWRFIAPWLKISKYILWTSKKCPSHVTCKYSENHFPNRAELQIPIHQPLKHVKAPSNLYLYQVVMAPNLTEATFFFVLGESRLLRKIGSTLMIWDWWKWIFLSVLVCSGFIPWVACHKKRGYDLGHRCRK